MKLLAIGDPHFKLDNVLETEAMVKDILDIARQTEPDYIVCLGDVLDRFSNIHVSPLVRATSFLRQLSLIAHLILIVGNHDRPNNSVFCTDQHPFTSLKDWTNTTVVDKPTKIANMLAVPYVPNGRFYEALAMVDTSDVEVILAHQEFRGAKMGAIVSTSGDEWEPDLPLVISGHIHDYQRLQPNIVYVGTPIQHGYGDREDKTISLFEMGDEIVEKRYSLPSVPIKRTVRITAEQAATYVPPKGDLIKLIVSGTKDALKLVKIKYPNVKVCYDTVTDTKPLLVKSQLSYLDNLYNKIEGLQYEKLWLDEILHV
jgi:DNA repair exonuclease SbcCD nuclease subunit